MHNMVSLLCAKGVQKLWIYHGKTCGDISTDATNNIVCKMCTRVKASFIRIILPMILPNLPTPKNHLYNLLSASYPHYPQYLLLTPPNEI